MQQTNVRPESRTLPPASYVQTQMPLLGVSNRCRDCERLRRYIDQQRDRIGELELRLEGAAQRERSAAIN